MEDLKTKEVRKFEPVEKTIIVKPVMRVRNAMITDPEHEAFFLFGTATTKYCLPVDRNNNLVNPFSSKEEQEWLEKQLDIDLNIYKQKDNYWIKKAKVTLGKDERKLNLRNPKDYLDYLILKANKRFIAPDGDSIHKLATYRYALVTEEFETQKAVKNSDKKKIAYKEFGRMEDKGKETLLNFLKVYGRRVSPESKVEFLKQEIDKIIEEDIDGFLKVVDDKDYLLKLKIAKAVEVGAIEKKNRLYFLPGGDILCNSGLNPTIENVIDYLNQPANADILSMINARIEKADKK